MYVHTGAYVVHMYNCVSVCICIKNSNCLYTIMLPEELKNCFKKYVHIRVEKWVTICCKTPCDLE